MMPFAITRLPDEPIVVVLIEVPLEQYYPNVMSVNAQLTSMVMESDAVLYILIDLTDQSPLFSDIMLGIDLLADPESWLRQPQTRAVLVGSHPVIHLAVKRFRQQLSVDLQHFQTLEEALAGVRSQIHSQK